MRKLTAVFLVLCALLICESAMAAPGDATLLRIGENDFSGGTSCIVEADGTIYILTWDALFTLENGEDTPVRREWNEQSFAMDDEIVVSRNCLVSDGETAYVICVDSEYDVEDQVSEIVGARLCELIINDDGEIGIDIDESVELDWDDMITEYGDNEGSRKVVAPFIMDGLLIFYTYLDNGNAVMAYDIEDEDYDELDVNIDYSRQSIKGLCKYKDEQLLLALTNREGGGSTTVLCSYDMEEEELTELCYIPNASSSDPKAFAYSAENDTVYYTLGGELFAITGMDEETNQSICDMPIGIGECVPVLTPDGFYIVGDLECVLRRNVDPSLRGGAKLTVQNVYNPSVQAAHHAFSNANSDVEVIVVSQVEDVVQAMMNRSPSVDVYQLATNSAQYDAVFSRKYMAELNESEKITAALDGMYPAIRELCVKDGETVALPVSIDFYNLGYDIDAFKRLGLSEDDVPETWVEFFESLPMLSEMVEDEPGMSLFESFFTALIIKNTLFEKMLDDYITYISQPGSEFAFDTPMFREMLSAFEAVDFFDLGLPEDEDEIDYTLSTTGFGEHNTVYNSYSEISARVFALDSMQQPLPLKLAEDIDPIIQVKLSVVFVNPFSQYREEAIRFVESIVDEMDGVLRIQLSPDENEPVEEPLYESTLKVYDDTIAALKTQIEKASEDDKPLYEQQLAENEEIRAVFAERYRYAASEESIAHYRGFADSMMIQRFIGLNDENSQEFYSYAQQFTDGFISADEFIRSIDKKLQMMMMEGQ